MFCSLANVWSLKLLCVLCRVVGAVSVQYEKLDGLFAEARVKKTNKSWAQESAY